MMKVTRSHAPKCFAKGQSVALPASHSGMVAPLQYAALLAAMLLVLVTDDAPARNQIAIQANAVRRAADVEPAGKTDPEEPDPTGPQVLEFADGNTVHGVLEGLDPDHRDLRWRRDDCSGTLSFSFPEIRRINFTPPSLLPPSGHATIKFTGSDWLTADLVELVDRDIELQLPDGSRLSVDRDQVEWIYLSKNAAPECYDGPTSLAGWSSGGGWNYRDGALRASGPTVVGRNFESLPDKVDYQLDIDQGSIVDAFTIVLHGSSVLGAPQGENTIQLQFLGAHLQMYAQVNGSMQVQNIEELPGVNLSNSNGPDQAPFSALKGEVDPHPKPFQLRILEDRTAGRLIIYVNGVKSKEWSIDKRKEGENRGCLTFQPMSWNSSSDQLISRVRVLPWDGRLPDEDGKDSPPSEVDQVWLADGTVKSGRLEDSGGESVKLRTSSDEVIVLPRADISLLRFARVNDPPDEDPPVARVILAHRGEFDVSAISFRDGKFVGQSDFSTAIPLSPSILRSLEFSRRTVPNTDAVDEMVFRNGDRIRGSLTGAGAGAKLRWRTTNGGDSVEFEPARIAGVLLAPPSAAGADFQNKDVTIRCRNGDLLTAKKVLLEKDQLAFETQQAGALSISRNAIRAVYFPMDGKAGVLSGLVGASLLESAPSELSAAYTRTEKPKRNSPPRLGEPWRYFNGAFTLLPGAYRSGSLRLGPQFDSMPQSVEVSFDVTAPREPLAFAVQLFSTEQNSGYLLQFQPQEVNIYDMQPIQRAGRVPQQEFQFNGKINEAAHERHVRLLAERSAGKVTILVDGVVLGQFGKPNPAHPRNLGTGITLVPQAGMPCTLSNFWVGPWNGRMPETSAPSKPNTTPDSVLLANGDETRGVIRGFGPQGVKLDCDAGPINLPADRVVMMEFGGSAEVSTASTRLRFGSLGIVSTKSYQIENGQVVLSTELAGTLHLPLSDLREIVLAAAPAENPQTP